MQRLPKNWSPYARFLAATRHASGPDWLPVFVFSVVSLVSSAPRAIQFRCSHPPRRSLLALSAQPRPCTSSAGGYRRTLSDAQHKTLRNPTGGQQREKLEKNARGAVGRILNPTSSLSGNAEVVPPCPTISYLPYAKYAYNPGNRQYRVSASAQSRYAGGVKCPMQNACRSRRLARKKIRKKRRPPFWQVACKLLVQTTIPWTLGNLLAESGSRPRVAQFSHSWVRRRQSSALTGRSANGALRFLHAWSPAVARRPRLRRALTLAQTKGSMLPGQRQLAEQPVDAVH